MSLKGNRLTIEHLKMFRDLVKTRNFRQAAALNFLTQSAISQQLRALEKHFNKKLIQREKGQFIVTPEGLALLEATQTILETLKQVKQTMQQVKGEFRGSVQIESAYSVGIHVLPPLIRNFMKKYPHITLQLTYAHSDRITADLLSGSCDIGIIILPCQEVEKYDIHPIFRERLAYICSPYHPHAKQQSVSIKDLKGQSFVSFNKNLQTRQLIDGLFQKHGVTVNILHESENVETMKRIVEVGGGVSILPEATVESEVKNKTLKRLTFEEGPFYREAGVAIRKGRVLSRAEQTLMQWLLSNPGTKMV